MTEKSYRLYGYRWMVLAVFMFINLTIQVLWIGYAPITGPAAAFYGVSDLQIGLLAMSFMIAFIPLSIPVSWAGEFELVNDAWTAVPTHNADFYLSLGGVDRTGTIYKSLAIAEGDGALSIQPNPNNGQFTISVEVAKAQDLALEVMDPQGKVVYEQALNGFAGTYRRDLDLSGMSAGVYLLKLKRGDQRSTHKVVVY